MKRFFFLLLSFIILLFIGCSSEFSNLKIFFNFSTHPGKITSPSVIVNTNRTPTTFYFTTDGTYPDQSSTHTTIENLNDGCYIPMPDFSATIRVLGVCNDKTALLSGDFTTSYLETKLNGLNATNMLKGNRLHIMDSLSFHVPYEGTIICGEAGTVNIQLLRFGNGCNDLYGAGLNNGFLSFDTPFTVNRNDTITISAFLGRPPCPFASFEINIEMK